MNADPAATAENAPRYFAWLYSASESRALLQALLAIEAEIREVLRPGMDHRVAHVRLEWWREESERLKAGQAVHPLTRSLTAIAPGIAGASRATSPGTGAAELTATAMATTPGRATPSRTGTADLTSRPNAGMAPDIDGLVAITIWDLASAAFGTRAEVAGYCERWATAMTQPLAHGQSFGRLLGAAILEIELLSALASEARSGRLRLPLDELEREGIPAEALAKPPWPDKLCALLRARHRELRAVLRSHTHALVAADQSAARGLLVWAALANRQSLRAEKALPNAVVNAGPAMWMDAWSAWRSARRAQKGSFRLPH